MKSGPIFCVDGGGSRSRGRLFDPSGAVLAADEDGPCNPSSDAERAAASLVSLWGKVARAAGIEASAPAGATLAIGAAGLYVPASRQALFARLPGFARRIAMSDGYAALIGAGGGRACAMVIVGTGVAGHRLHADGTSVQRDAWGWVGGDRGSGAWIGRKALRHALSVCDGVRPPDRLALRVLERFGGRDKIATAIRGIGPAELATLAPLVLAAADESVAAGQRILDRAVDHLADLVRALDLPPSDPLYVAGGLAAALGPKLGARLGRAIDAPAADATTGCFLVASGRAPEERIAADPPLAEALP